LLFAIQTEDWLKYTDVDQYSDRRDVHVRVDGAVAVTDFLLTKTKTSDHGKQVTDVRSNETYNKRKEPGY